METHPLYIQLKAEIELAKKEAKHAVMIDNSEALSADQIHRWFPDLEVSWKNNHIHVRWAN
jgi:hypothetical protein